MCSTERKYPTDKPWAFIRPSIGRTAQGLPCKSDTFFSNDANRVGLPSREHQGVKKQVSPLAPRKRVRSQAERRPCPSRFPLRSITPRHRPGS